MTTLRDDGYLETDDPVVAACFLKRHVLVEDYDDPVLIDFVSDTWWMGHDGEELGYQTYPILIPASVVAEVWDMSGIAANVLTLAILKLPWTGQDIHEWLRKYADPGA